MSIIELPLGIIERCEESKVPHLPPGTLNAKMNEQGIPYLFYFNTPLLDGLVSFDAGEGAHIWRYRSVVIEGIRREHWKKNARARPTY